MLVHLFVCGDRNKKFIKQNAYCHSIDTIIIRNYMGTGITGSLYQLLFRGSFWIIKSYSDPFGVESTWCVLCLIT